MDRFKKIFKAIDTWFNKVIQKGGEKPVLEYMIKYFMACGIGFNVIILFVIIMQFVT